MDWDGYLWVVCGIVHLTVLFVVSWLCNMGVFYDITDEIEVDLEMYNEVLQRLGWYLALSMILWETLPRLVCARASNPLLAQQCSLLVGISFAPHLAEGAYIVWYKPIMRHFARSLVQWDCTCGFCHISWDVQRCSRVTVTYTVNSCIAPHLLLYLI